MYAVTPEEPFVWGGYYERSSLIWRSRWVTTSGVVECREALAFPGDPGCAVLLRRIMAVRGDARVHVVCDPRPGFGAHGLRSPRRGDDGVWRTDLGGVHLRWSGADDASVRTTAHGDRRLETIIEIPARRPPRPRPRTRGPADHRPPSRRRSPLAGDRDRLAGDHPPDRDGRRSRRAARRRRHARPDEQRWRHGGRRHHQPARAQRRRTQLRLPLRLDPRPVLRRAGRGHRRMSTPSWTTRSASSPHVCSTTGPPSDPPTPSAVGRPRAEQPGPARIPRGP